MARSQQQNGWPLGSTLADNHSRPLPCLKVRGKTADSCPKMISSQKLPAFTRDRTPTTEVRATFSKRHRAARGKFPAADSPEVPLLCKQGFCHALSTVVLPSQSDFHGQPPRAAALDFAVGRHFAAGDRVHAWIWIAHAVLTAPSSWRLLSE